MKDNKVWVAGLFYFVFIPFLLVFIYLMSSGLEDVLPLQTFSPTLLSVIGAHYFHLDFYHLLSNLIFYLVFIIVIFWFDVLTNRRMLFVNMLLLFVFLPIFCSLVDIAAFSGKSFVGYGFSAVAAGLFGYLTFSFLHFLRDYYKMEFKNDIMAILWLIFFVNLFLISTTYAYFYIAVCLAVLILVWAYRIRFDILKIFDVLRSKDRVKRTVTMGVLTFCLFVGVTLLFPETIRYNDSIIDILAHYTGYSFGIIVPAMVSTYLVERGER